MTFAVKICGLSTPETLDAALQAGADTIGFVFHPRSPRNVGLEQAASLVARTAGHARTVALIVDMPPDQARALCASVRPDLLQLHGRETPQDVAHMRAHHTALLPDQMPGLTRNDAMAAALGLTHHGERGVFVDLERLQRVGNKQDIHGQFFY